MRRVPANAGPRRINGVLFECGGGPEYFDSYAPLVTHMMRRLLKPGDVFFDVGANIGYLSAIAAGLVGVAGQVHAFEPVPQYFARLQWLAEMNPDRTIIANTCAAGDADTTRTIYLARAAGQSTLISSYKRRDEVVGSQEIRVVRLDSYIEQARLDRIALIKIDVEGYELPVLKGLEGYFRRTGQRPPIICEIAPRAYSLLGRTLSELGRYMRDFGYSAFDLADGVTPVDVCSIDCVDDVLFLARPA